MTDTEKFIFEQKLYYRDTLIDISKECFNVCDGLGGNRITNIL